MHLQSLYQAKRRASNVRMEDGQIRLGPACWSHENLWCEKCADSSSNMMLNNIHNETLVKQGFQATYCTTWFNYISPSVQVFEFGRWGSRWSPYRAGHWMSLGCVSGIIPFVGCHGQERLKVGICIKNSNQFLKYEGTLSLSYGSKRCQRHHKRSQFRIRRSIPEDPISLNLLPDD